MKFEELTEKDKDYIAKTYKQKDSDSWDARITKLASKFGVTQRTMRRWASGKLELKEKPDVEPEQYVEAKKKVADKTKKRFIITWGQNNTPVHESFLTNLLAYAKYLKAGVHVIAGRYKNPTSVFTDVEYEHWVDEIAPYLDANRHDVHKYLSIMSDIKIQPTATNPMSSLQSMSGINSCVFGSPKIQLEMIPVLQSDFPKMMMTTGAVTLPNYTDSKNGKKGEFHHTFGFVVVEIKDNQVFFMRQVTADDKAGSFTDLFYRVENGKVKQVKECEAIIWGDLHFGHHDKKVFEKTLELCNKLVPKHVILHDVFDGYSINHHEMKDPYKQYKKELQGKNDVQKEVNDLLEGLKVFQKFKNVIIVRGNHDDFLDRWLANEDWKKQPTTRNAEAYMRFSAMLLRQQADEVAFGKEVRGVLPELINDKYPKFKTLGLNDSYKVKSWEVGQHGHIGKNGSRGGFMQFRGLNTKIVTAHSHTPQRKDGAMCVGTTTILRMGYNNGPSSWLHSHVILHSDGKGQHVNFINGEYTTFK